MTAKKKDGQTAIQREEAAERKLNEAVATAKRLKVKSRAAKKRMKQAKKAAKEASRVARKARKAAEKARREYQKMQARAAKQRKKAARAKAPIVTPRRRTIDRAHDRQFLQP